MRIEELVKSALDKLGIAHAEIAKMEEVTFYYDGHPASIAPDFAVYRDPEQTEYFFIHGEYPLTHYLPNDEDIIYYP